MADSGLVQAAQRDFAPDSATKVIESMIPSIKFLRAGYSLPKEPIQKRFEGAPGDTSLYSRPGLFELASLTPSSGDRAAMFDIDPQKLRFSLSLSSEPVQLTQSDLGELVAAAKAPPRPPVPSNPSESSKKEKEKAKTSKEKKDKKDKKEKKEKDKKEKKDKKDKKDRKDKKEKSSKRKRSDGD